MSCETCNKHRISGSNHACVEDGKVYPIPNYPVQSSACGSFESKGVVAEVKKKSRDPLEALLRSKLSKPTPLKTDLAPKIPEKEISLKSGAGWVVSAGLAGALIADVLLRLV